MMRVRIIRSPANQLEEKINNFLEGLGRQEGVKISLHDIKLYHIATKDYDTAMIIYNQTINPPQTKRQNGPKLR